MLKDEVTAIDEWVSHYRARGVEHFVIVDDESSDGSYEKLKDYEASGCMTVFSSRGVDWLARRQETILNTLTLSTLRRFDWVLAVDADEFVWDTVGYSLSDYLCDVDVSVNLLLPMWDFGDNGLVHQPASLVESFTRRRATAARHAGNVKSLTRTANLKRLSIHVAQVSGRSVADHRLQLNHYKLQSRERWENLVVPRGSANDAESGRVRHAARFFDDNSAIMNEVEDLGLLLQNRGRS